MEEPERYRRRRATRQKSLNRLGVTNIRCLCGETDPVCFEADHIYRRAHDPTCWGLCLNCHRKRTVRGETEHPRVHKPSSEFERLGHMILGVCDYLTFIVEHLRRAAEVLFRLAGIPPKPKV